MRINYLRFGLLLTLMLSASLNAQGLTQQYAKGKLFLANGMNIEGKNLRMTMESATVEVMGMDQTFMLEDIVQVMAKQDKGKRYGKVCAGSCVALSLLSILAAPDVGETDEYGNEVTVEQDPASLLMGAALWGGISYGVGYLVGQLNDDWEIVYLNRG